MARKRSGTIEESHARLIALEHQFRNQPVQLNRIRMLRMLKDEPSLTLLEVSERLGCSERSVNRWLHEYHRAGLAALVRGLDGDDSRMRINQSELEELRSKLKSGSVGTLNEIQCWLKDRFGVEYSLKAISNILQHRLKARRVWVIP